MSESDLEVVRGVLVVVDHEMSTSHRSSQALVDAWGRWNGAGRPLVSKTELEYAVWDPAKGEPTAEHLLGAILRLHAAWSEEEVGFDTIVARTMAVVRADEHLCAVLERLVGTDASREVARTLAKRFVDDSEDLG